MKNAIKLTGYSICQFSPSLPNYQKRIRYVKNALPKKEVSRSKQTWTSGGYVSGAILAFLALNHF
jgi:hypothetical protein